MLLPIMHSISNDKRHFINDSGIKQTAQRWLLKAGLEDTGDGSLELLQAHGTGYDTRVSTSFPKKEKNYYNKWINKKKKAKVQSL